MEKQEPYDIECLFMHKKIGFDLTLPGHNYLGPGTDIINNLHEGVAPTDDADLLAMQHDYDYLNITTESDIIRADNNFLSNAGDTESVLSGALLALKTVLNLNDIFLGPDKIPLTEKLLLGKQKQEIEKSYANEHSLTQPVTTQIGSGNVYPFLKTKMENHP